jgi:hypothetical protein
MFTVSCKVRAVIINSPYFLNGLHHDAPGSLLLKCVNYVIRSSNCIMLLERLIATFV